MYLQIEIEFIHKEIIRAYLIAGDNQRGKRLPMTGQTLGPTMILSQNRISGSG